ncbi:MAG: HAD family phosphatase, partial [Mesorhizobium sp.]
MTEIRHIVFDIGKVLVHYDPDIPFSRLIPDAGERKWFFDNVCTSAWNL